MFLDRLIAGEDLSLSSQEREALIASAPYDAMPHYNAFIQRTFGLSHHYPSNINQASFPYMSEYGDLIMASMYVTLRPVFQLPTFPAAPISAPISISVNRESPRQMTVFPGGGSFERIPPASPAA